MKNLAEKEFHPMDDHTSYPPVDGAAAPENSGTPETPEANDDETALTLVPVEKMTDREIEAYYEFNGLGTKHHATMNEYELDVVQRYGAIMAGRRNQAEIDAQNVTLYRVRRKVQEQVDRYGTAQYLVERLAENNARLSREDPGPQVKITIHCNGVEVSMGFAEIQEAYNQRQNSQTIDFNRKVNDLLSLLKVTANQAKARACKVDGKSYDNMVHDITWKNVLSNLNAEHNAE